MKITALVFLLVLASCSTYRGVEEFGLYKEAFQQARTTSDVILDRVAVAERRLWRKCTNFDEIKTSGQCIPFDAASPVFRVTDAPFLVDAVDPPFTAALRRAMVATTAYTEALHGLASGQTAEAVAGQIGQLAGIVATASSTIVPAAAAASPLADFAAKANDINEDIAALSSPIVTLAGFAARAEFRRQLMANHARMEATLRKIEELSPVLFAKLAADKLVGLRSHAAIEAATREIQENRILIANWVIMLEASQQALAAAKKAVEDDTGGGAAGLILTANALTQAAQNARKALAGDIE